MFTVALYGNSLALASIGALLERRAGLHTITVDAPLPGAMEKLSAIQPDVVLLDLETAQPNPFVELWKTRPELSFIGVDLGADRMLILSGQPARGLTADRLMETLMAHAARPSCPICDSAR